MFKQLRARFAGWRICRWSRDKKKRVILHDELRRAIAAGRWIAIKHRSGLLYIPTWKASSEQHSIALSIIEIAAIQRRWQ